MTMALALLSALVSTLRRLVVHLHLLLIDGKLQRDILGGRFAAEDHNVGEAGGANAVAVTDAE